MSTPSAVTAPTASGRAKPKRSAEGNAALRYAGAQDPNPRLRNPDWLAGDFIRRRFRTLAETVWLRKVALPFYEGRFPGAYAYQTARTRLFDAVLLDAVQRGGVRQVLMLGAGCDSRGLRFQRQIGDATVFELDFPATQARKMGLLRRAGRPGWDSIRYIPVDFEVDDWPTLLQHAGFDHEQRSVVLWEGVAMFLEPSAAHRTLEFVHGCAEGSSIVFDYVVADALTQPDRYLGGQQVARYMTRGEEHWKFGVAHDDVETVVGASGLQLWGLWTPEALAAEFIGAERGSPPRPVLGFHGVAHAGVGLPTVARAS